MHCNNGYVDACKGCSLQQMKRPQSTSIGSEPLTPTQKRRQEEDHLTKRRKKINFRSSTEWANMLPACQWTPVLAHTSHMYVCMLTWKYCIYWLSHWQAGCDGGRRLWWARPTLRCFFISASLKHHRRCSVGGRMSHCKTCAAIHTLVWKDRKKNMKIVRLFSCQWIQMYCSAVHTRTAHSDAKPFILVDSIYFDIYGNYARSEFGGALTVS